MSLCLKIRWAIWLTFVIAAIFMVVLGFETLFIAVLLPPEERDPVYLQSALLLLGSVVCWFLRLTVGD